MVGARWARGEHRGVLLPGIPPESRSPGRQARTRRPADAWHACPGFSLIIRWRRPRHLTWFGVSFPSSGPAPGQPGAPLLNRWHRAAHAAYRDRVGRAIGWAAAGPSGRPRPALYPRRSASRPRCRPGSARRCAPGSTLPSPPGTAVPARARAAPGRWPRRRRTPMPRDRKGTTWRPASARSARPGPRRQARSGRWRDQADFTARFTSADVTPMAAIPRTAARRPVLPPATPSAAATASQRPELLAALESRRSGSSSEGVGVAATAE